MTPKKFRTAAAAKMLGMHPRTLRHHVHQGNITAVNTSISSGRPEYVFTETELNRVKKIRAGEVTKGTKKKTSAR